MKETHETGKGNYVLMECLRARTITKVCKVDLVMKFEVNMTHYNEVKPIHFFLSRQSGMQ